MPEDVFKWIRLAIKKEWKIAFYSTVIIGFLTHMYVFTNMLPNHDGLINIYSEQQKYSSGRFFLSQSSGITSFFDLPWIIGVFSILYLSITSVLYVELFRLKQTSAIILSSGLIVTFPTVASTFSYMFTADAYMAGILLAFLAIFVTQKYKFGFLAGGLILYISVGIYQANLSVLLTIITLWFINELLVHRKYKPLIFELSRLVIMGVIGMVLYAITFKIYQQHGEITSYQGLNQIGGQLGGIKDNLRTIKETVNDFFLRGFVSDFPVNLFEVLNIFLLILIVIGIIVLFIQHKLSILKTTLLVTSLVLLPVFSYILYFVSPGVSYHMLMVMALVSIYLVPIIFYERLDKPNALGKLFSWGAVITLALVIFNFAIISNIAYFNMTLKYEKSYSLANRILDRVEETEGYEKVTKLAIIGRKPVHTNISTDRVTQSIPKMTGAMGEVFLVQPYHFSAMLENQLGTKIGLVNREELDSLKASDLVQEMVPWPSKESIQIIGEVAIIKLSD
ncbi:glucosyltransferase domain-containing protein [Ornithinibacillus californiensis]|uniref:glucosyltransferase domain-containing protein n=1 Tax=Ornithinibacillus californiensis TaxID=161536 RepID=UPI00064D8A2C|nr:glucosyltransferase domain-containing protein [Ornithinibacillus californiensis]